MDGLKLNPSGNDVSIVCHLLVSQISEHGLDARCHLAEAAWQDCDYGESRTLDSKDATTGWHL